MVRLVLQQQRAAGVGWEVAWGLALERAASGLGQSQQGELLEVLCCTQDAWRRSFQGEESSRGERAVLALMLALQGGELEGLHASGPPAPRPAVPRPEGLEERKALAARLRREGLSLGRRQRSPGWGRRRSSAWLQGGRRGPPAICPAGHALDDGNVYVERGGGAQLQGLQAPAISRLEGAQARR